MIEELKDQIEYKTNKNIEKNEEILKNKKKLNLKLKENNIDVDIDSITNSNQVALSLIERIEKNDLEEKENIRINNLIKNEILIKIYYLLLFSDTYWIIIYYIKYYTIVQILLLNII